MSTEPKTLTVEEFIDRFSTALEWTMYPENESAVIHMYVAEDNQVYATPNLITMSSADYRLLESVLKNAITGRSEA